MARHLKFMRYTVKSYSTLFKITIGETVGLVLMAMTTSATTWMLYPATLLIGICGLMVLRPLTSEVYTAGKHVVI